MKRITLFFSFICLILATFIACNDGSLTFVNDMKEDTSSGGSSGGSSSSSIPIVVTAKAVTICVGSDAPALEYTTDPDPLPENVELTGALACTFDKDIPDVYPITQGTLKLSGKDADKYFIVYVEANLTVAVDPRIYVDGQTLKTAIKYFHDRDSLPKTFVKSSDAPQPTQLVSYLNGLFLWYDSDNKIVYYYSENGMTYITGSCKELFNDCKYFTSIDFTGFDTSMTDNMMKMFSGCLILADLTFDADHFLTSNVTDMSLMFINCNTLAELDLSHFDTGKVTTMQKMFMRCFGLASLNLGGSFGKNTANVEDMSYMFSNCTALSDLTLYESGSEPSLNTSSVKDMSYMFKECSSLTSLNVKNWDVGQVKNFAYMFAGKQKSGSTPAVYIKIGQLDVKNWDVGQNITETDPAKLIDMTCMFDYCNELTSIDMSGWNFSKIMDINRMFDRCEKLSTIIFPDNTDLTNIKNMMFVFGHTFKLTPEYLRNNIISKWIANTNIYNIFNDNSSTDGDNYGQNRIVTNDMDAEIAGNFTTNTDYTSADSLTLHLGSCKNVKGQRLSKGTK